MGVDVLELYGGTLPETVDAALRERLERAYCPFRRYHCDQIDSFREDGGCAAAASRPHGVCLVRDDSGDGHAVPVCPSRMLEGGVAIADAERLLLHGGRHCDLYLLPGVAIPDGGLVDYLLVAARDGLPIDFVGIDLCPLHANGPLCRWRAAALTRRGLSVAADEARTVESGADADARAADGIPPVADPSPPNTASPAATTREALTAQGLRFWSPDGAVELDWRASARELLLNAHHKLGFFERLGKRLVVAVPESLATYMMEEFAFDLLPRGHGRESLRLHAYAFTPRALTNGAEGEEDDTGESARPPVLTNTLLLDSMRVALALGLQASVHEELEAVMAQLSGRLTPEYHWRRVDDTTSDAESV